MFHSSSIGSPSILSKALYSCELLNHVNLSSHAMFDWGFSFTFPRQNTESENPLTFVCWRLMTSSSPTKDKCFHEESSQLIVFTPQISSDCSVINFSDMSNICFVVRSSVFFDGMPIVCVILHHEYRWFQCYRHEHSPYHRMFVAVLCCIFWGLFLPLSHLITHPVQELSGS